MDARKKPHLQNAPQVIYSHREPPLEIRHVPGLLDSESQGYITFGKGAEPLYYIFNRIVYTYTIATAQLLTKDMSLPDC